MNKQIKKYQSGIALPVGLMLLLIVTIVGISSYRTTVQEERQSGNMRKREVAFQAAEAALRDAERRTGLITDIHQKVFQDNGGTSLIDGEECLNGYCLPAKYDTNYDKNAAPGDSTYLYERWVDVSNQPGSLTVWDDTSRHIDYVNNSVLQSAGEPVDAKYIIEFVGYVHPDENSTNCVDTQPSGGDGVPDNPLYQVWPWCPDDPPMYRISAYAEAGGGARVLLQTTYRQGT